MSDDIATLLWYRIEKLERQLDDANVALWRKHESIDRDAARYRRLRENWLESSEIGLSGRLAVVDAKVDALLGSSHFGGATDQTDAVR